MQYLTNKQSIIDIFLYVPLPDITQLEYNYSKMIAKYITEYYFGPNTKEIIDILINYYAETFGKDSLNNILHAIYSDKKSVNKDKIHLAITSILSYQPIIEYRVFSACCYVADYDLIKYSFDLGIKLKYSKIHPLMRVINSNTDTRNIIRIIDLFLDNGLDIIEFVNTEYFFMSYKLDVIKYIVNRSNNYNYNYLHEICQCITEIDLTKYNEKDFTDTIDYFVLKTLEDYQTIDTPNNYGITALRTIYSNYIVTKYKSLFQYVVSKLILYGADITLLKDKVFVPLYQYGEEDELIVLDFYNYTNNIMVARSDAIEYVREVSEYLLPDIANVVFAHAYNFNPNEHYNLALSL